MTLATFASFLIPNHKSCDTVDPLPCKPAVTIQHINTKLIVAITHPTYQHGQFSMLICWIVIAIVYRVRRQQYHMIRI